MRPTPTFDPRIQPVGVYIGGPPNRYPTPMMPQNMPIQQGYAQMPMINQPVQPAGYQIHIPQNQVPAQYINDPARAPRQQIIQAPVSGESLKPSSVPANNKMVSDAEVYKQQEAEQYEQQEGQGDEQYQQQYNGQYNDGQQQEQMQNQQIIMFWEHKFYTILERFQLIFEKVEMIRADFYNLNTQLKNVDSEEQWNQAKDHHEDFMEQLQQFSQELAGVIKENASLVEQNQNQDNQHNIWKDRYFQLFEGYKAMQAEFIELKQTKGEEGKVNELMANYTELSRQYSQMASQLAELKQKGKAAQPSPDKNYRQKLDFAIREAEKYKQALDHLHKQNEQMIAMIEDLKEQKHNLQMAVQSNNNQANYQQNYEEFNRAINERDQQINLLNKQLKQLSQKYNFLVETHNAMSNRIQEEEPRIKSKFSQLEQQVNSKNMELMEIRSKLLQAQLKQRSTSTVSEEYQKILKIRTAQVQERDLELQRVKRQYAQVSNSRKSESDKDLAAIKKQFDVRVKRIEDQYQEKLDVLKKKLRKKQQQTQGTTLLSIKLESFEKKNKLLLQQIESLNNDLNLKQKQSMELKRVSNIQQKYKELESQYNSVVEEKQQISAALNQKNYDMEGLQNQINEFESRIKNLSDNTHNSNSKPLLNQIQQLNKIIQVKENQINKLKANLNLKDGNIRQIQNEVQRSRSAAISNEKLYSREKQGYVQTIRSLERKNQQNEKKMRQLQFEYGSIMKKNLQDQIKNLRSQNQLKQENIFRLEAEELELRSRLSHYERIRSTHSSDLDELTNRIKQLETSKYDMIKKVENAFKDVKNKERENRQLADSLKTVKDNVTKLEVRISENEKVIYEKDKIIQNIEGQLMVANSRLAYISEEHDSLRLRKRDETDLLTKQSDDLRRKIFQYEHLNGSKKQFKQKFSSQITKIQNQMIQQLKEQKQFLKSELAVALQQIGNLPTRQKSTSGKKPKASEGIDYIQKRLFDFNNRLDQIITKNKQLNRGFGSNIQNSKVSTYRADRDNEEQIKNLKNQIQELRKYISKLQVEAAGQTIKFNPKNELIYQEQQKIYTQRVDFYQKQANQLQGRIQSLIKVNTNLKERIDSLLKDGGNSPAIEFYKNQLSISEETIENLHNKISKIMEQNRSLKSNSNEYMTKICRQYEDRIFEFENKIFLLQRKVSALELQKNKIENNKVDIQRNLNLLQTQLQTLKYSSQKQVDTYKKNSKQLAEQVLRFQNESTELLQKIRMLESENSRLSQAVNASYSQQHILLNTPVKDITPKQSHFRK